MSSQFVIDASIAAKWLFLEEGSDKAEGLLESYNSFIVPELFYIEMDAIISKKVRQGELPAVDANRKRDQVMKLALQKFDHQTISKLAFEISISLPVTFYDALYLSLAIETKSIMWTADSRLVNGLSNTVLANYIQNPLLK
jgi:predicted nucleic acid-binding protein